MRRRVRMTESDIRKIVNGSFRKLFEDRDREEKDLYKEIGNRSQYADPDDVDDIYDRQAERRGNGGGQKAMYALSDDEKVRKYGRSKKHASKLDETIKRSLRSILESMDSDNLMDRCGDTISELCEEMRNSALGGDSHKVMVLAKKIAECADEISDYINSYYNA